MKNDNKYEILDQLDLSAADETDETFYACFDQQCFFNPINGYISLTIEIDAKFKLSAADIKGKYFDLENQYNDIILQLEVLFKDKKINENNIDYNFFKSNFIPANIEMYFWDEPNPPKNINILFENKDNPIDAISILIFMDLFQPDPQGIIFDFNLTKKEYDEKYSIKRKTE